MTFIRAVLLAMGWVAAIGLLLLAIGVHVVNGAAGLAWSLGLLLGAAVLLVLIGYVHLEDRVRAVEGHTPATPCRCGHPARVHEHYRAGTDCGVCGPTACPRYRSESQRKARHRERQRAEMYQLAKLQIQDHREQSGAAAEQLALIANGPRRDANAFWRRLGRRDS